VLGGVLQRLTAAEVHGGLDVLGEPLVGSSIQIENGSRVRLGHVRLQRAGQPSIREQRREDASGEIAQLRERVIRQVADIHQRTCRAIWIAPQSLGRQTRCDGNRYQMLLRAVVNVALDATSLGILGGHDALTRRPQLLGLRLERQREANVAERRTRLRGQVSQ
jgi:hypothetical protein